MEKIKDALKKAKALDRGLGTVSSKFENKSSGNVAVKNIDGLNSIVYKQTTVVNLDPATLENYRIVAQNKHDPTSWVFDSLRTRVIQKMEENNWRTIAIVSPTPEAGKTVVAINLAISIAQQPKKTAMLVDFDLRKPRVAK